MDLDDNRGWFAFMNAALRGDVEVLNALMHGSANVDRQTLNGWTAVIE